MRVKKDFSDCVTGNENVRVSGWMTIFNVDSPSDEAKLFACWNYRQESRLKYQTHDKENCWNEVISKLSCASANNKAF